MAKATSKKRKVMIPKSILQVVVVKMIVAKLQRIAKRSKLGRKKKRRKTRKNGFPPKVKKKHFPSLQI